MIYCTIQCHHILESEGVDVRASTESKNSQEVSSTSSHRSDEETDQSESLDSSSKPLIEDRETRDPEPSAPIEPSQGFKSHILI